MKLNELWKNLIIRCALIFALVVGILELINYTLCKDSLLCIALDIFFLYPGLKLGDYIPGISGVTLIITNLIIYFLIGALIGYLVQRFKK